MEDIHEPLDQFRDTLRDQHAENTAELFDKLVERAGIDIPANRKTVAEIRRLEASIASETSRRSAWSAFNVVCIVAAVLAAILIGVSLYSASNGSPLLDESGYAIAGAVVLGGTLLSLLLCRPKLREADARLADLNEQRNAAEQVGWEQMAALNRLFDWAQPANLIHKTAPRIEFDPYFSVGRLCDLQRVYKWDGTFNQSRSVLFSHSGEINGNPFVLAETRFCEMVQKTYHGSLTITWSESYTDANGRRQTRLRTQTLHASVQKPYPTYPEEKVLIYGNEAAPDLTFSRVPSSLSGLSDNVLSRWRKKAEIKRLEKFSRNLDDEYGFTMMANQEFEALFHATDRSSEVQFRLLFTPLAQREMLKLLKDKEVGYGDDFRFTKYHCINMIRPEHLQSLPIDTNPAQFQSYDYDASRQAFLSFNEEFFRGLYFTLAPLLAIPLYQQYRSHESIYGTKNDRCSSFWEHESLANFFGTGRFKHPECVTECLLKTQSSIAPDGSTRIDVTAHGYRGIPRTDYVSVFGGDGRMHDVPVNWTEYLPVQQTSPLSMVEAEGLSLQDYQDRLAAPTDRPDLPCPWDPRSIASVFRRSILARK